MKKILLILTLLCSLAATAQVIPGATPINSRYDWLGGKFKGLKIPAYADSTQYLLWLPNLAGDIFLDTAGVDAGTIYSRSGQPPYWKAISGGGTSDVSGKLNKSDTASMLNPYLRDAGYGLSKTGRALSADTGTLFPAVRASIPSSPGSLLGSTSISKTGDSLTVNKAWLEQNVSIKVANRAALRARIPIANATYITGGFYTDGDGGGHEFRYDAASTLPDDSATVLNPNSSGAGRYLIVRRDLTLRDFGALPDGTTDNAWFINKAFNFVNTYITLDNQLSADQGVFRHTNTAFFGISATAFVTNGFLFKGAGQMTHPLQANKGGTGFLYDGPSGTGTVQFQVNPGGFRYLRFEDFSVGVSYNDQVAKGFRIASSEGSDFTMVRVKIGHYDAAPTQAYLIEKGTGLNAEFFKHEFCKFIGTQDAYLHTAGQALACTFISCEGFVQHSGTLISLTESAGQRFTGGSFSGRNGALGGEKARKPSQSFIRGQYATSNGNVYTAVQTTTATTSSDANGGPSGTSNGQVDGGVTWNYVRPRTGTVLLKTAGPQYDAINLNLDRSEAVDVLIEAGNADVINVNMTGLTQIVPKQIGSGFDWIRFTSTTQSTRLYINGLSVFSRDTDGESITSRDQKLPINFGPSNNANIVISNTTFYDTKPVIRMGTTGLPLNASGANLGGQVAQYYVALQDVSERYNFGSAASKVDLVNKVLIDTRTGGKQTRKQENNILLQSAFGVATGSNQPFAAPWFTYGNPLSPLVQRYVNGTSGETGSDNVSIRVDQGSSVLQNITNVPLGTANQFFKYDADVVISRGARVRFMLRQSDDTLNVYDSITYQGSAATNGYKSTLVHLDAKALATNTGYVQLVIQNLTSNQSVQLDFLGSQGITQLYNGVPTPTTTEVVLNPNQFQEIFRTLAVRGKLQVPVWNNTDTVRNNGGVRIDPTDGVFSWYYNGWRKPAQAPPPSIGHVVATNTASPTQPLGVTMSNDSTINFNAKPLTDTSTAPGFITPNTQTIPGAKTWIGTAAFLTNVIITNANRYLQLNKGYISRTGGSNGLVVGVNARGEGGGNSTAKMSGENGVYELYRHDLGIIGVTRSTGDSLTINPDSSGAAYRYDTLGAYYLYKYGGSVDSLLGIGADKKVKKFAIGAGGGGDVSGKLNISDTAAMLTPYAQQLNVTNADNLRLLKTDTAAMLAAYVRLAGFGLVKSGQSLAVDTATLQKQYFRGTGATSISQVADTTYFNTPLKTVNGNSLYGAGDITITGGGGSITVDAIPTNGSSNAVSSNGVFDTLAVKLFIRDTASMLSPYLRKVAEKWQADANGINYTGNVGIGGSSVSDAKLYVPGKVRIEGSGSYLQMSRIDNTDPNFMWGTTTVFAIGRNLVPGGSSASSTTVGAGFGAIDFTTGLINFRVDNNYLTNSGSGINVQLGVQQTAGMFLSRRGLTVNRKFSLAPLTITDTVVNSYRTDTIPSLMRIATGGKTKLIEYVPAVGTSEFYVQKFIKTDTSSSPVKIFAELAGKISGMDTIYLRKQGDVVSLIGDQVEGGSRGAVAANMLAVLEAGNPVPYGKPNFTWSDSLIRINGTSSFAGKGLAADVLQATNALYIPYLVESSGARNTPTVSSFGILTSALGTRMRWLSTTSSTLLNSTQYDGYSYKGTTTATFTLPDPTVQANKDRVVWVKNKSAFNLTVTSFSGSQIYDNGAIASFVLAPGDAAMLSEDDGLFSRLQ